MSDATQQLNSNLIDSTLPTRLALANITWLTGWLVHVAGSFEGFFLTEFVPANCCSSFSSSWSILCCIEVTGSGFTLPAANATQPSAAQRRVT
jgi:hypothetical protein